MDKKNVVFLKTENKWATKAVDIVGLEECHTTVCQQKEKTIILKTEHVKSWRQNRLGQKEGR